MKFDEYITEVNQRQLMEYGVISAIEKRCQPFIKEFRNTGSKGILYRGTNKESTTSIKEIQPRTDREPKDMPIEAHNELNHMFFQKFGWSVRAEGVFATSKLITAKAYGEAYIFIPVGKYSYVYNPNIDDLFSELEEYINSASDDYDYNDYENDWEYEFGEGKNGEWFYDYESTDESDLNDAMEKISNEKNIDKDDINLDDFIWEPDKSLEEYTEEKHENDRHELEKKYNEVIKGYKNKNLKLAISSKVEIMFKCETYFMINKSFDNVILDYLTTGKVRFNTKQIEFEFEKNPKIRKQFAEIIPFHHKKFLSVYSTDKKKQELKIKYNMNKSSWKTPYQDKLKTL